jgi:hypothetical protein
MSGADIANWLEFLLHHESINQDEDVYHHLTLGQQV